MRLKRTRRPCDSAALLVAADWTSFNAGYGLGHFCNNGPAGFEITHVAVPKGNQELACSMSIRAWRTVATATELSSMSSGRLSSTVCWAERRRSNRAMAKNGHCLEVARNKLPKATSALLRGDGSTTKTLSQNEKASKIY